MTWKYQDLATSLYVEDVDRSIDFYTKTLGFKRGEVMLGEDGKTSIVAQLWWGDKAFNAVRASEVPSDADYIRQHRKAPLGRGVVLTAVTKDLEAYHKSLKGKEGIEILCSPEDTPWGARVMDVRDINGYTWSFIEPPPGEK